jgi:hypothetical protein
MKAARKVEVASESGIGSNLVAILWRFSKLPKLTVILGAILVVLGAAAYVGTGMTSWTALIPSIAGIPFLLLGLVALKDSLRKHAMHLAALLAVVACAGTARGLAGTMRLVMGQPVERPIAQVVQAMMSVLCALFVILCIRSFIQARRKTPPAA